MSDEPNALVPEELPDEEVQDEPEEQEPSWREKVDWDAMEKKALEYGWKPEGVEGKDFVDPVTFLARHDAIKSTKRQSENHEKALREIRRTQREMLEHQKKQAYEQAKAELDESHKRAVEEGNHQAARQVAEKMAELKQPEPAVDNTKVVSDWVARNPWYTTDRIKQAAAQNFYAQRISELGYEDAEEILPWVEQQMEEHLAKPDVSKVTAPPVETPVRRVAKGKAKWRASDITDDATKRQGRRFVEQGLYKSLDEFAQELGETGVLG